jgi:hypothetical protein
MVEWWAYDLVMRSPNILSIKITAFDRSIKVVPYIMPAVVGQDGLSVFAVRCVRVGIRPWLA